MTMRRSLENDLYDRVKNALLYSNKKKISHKYKYSLGLDAMHFFFTDVNVKFRFFSLSFFMSLLVLKEEKKMYLYIPFFLSLQQFFIYDQFFVNQLRRVCLL